MTELIVRELRLRAYDALLATPPGHSGARPDDARDAGTPDDAPRPPRLVARYSRRRSPGAELER